MFVVIRNSKIADHLPTGSIYTGFDNCSCISYSPADETYELPQLPTDDSTVKANPARSENVITSSNAAYGDFQIPRQEYDTKEEEKGKRWNKRNQGTFRYIRLFKFKQQVLIVVINS